MTAIRRWQEQLRVAATAMLAIMRVHYLYPAKGPDFGQFRTCDALLGHRNRSPSCPISITLN